MSLTQLIKTQIAQSGPLRLDAYMALCLLHPDHGYYATRDPLGAQGDFTTAPEISQMFGEVIGLSIAQSWLDQGAPASFSLVEYGPGRGTLMADILRATAKVPGFHDAAELILLEASAPLKKRQQDRLGNRPRWIEKADDLPDQPSFAVANEFFDALPIRQFVRAGDLWRERQVGLSDDALSLGLGPALPQPSLDHRLDDTKDGDLIEDCAAAAPLLAPLTNRIAQHGGAALVIDYGDWRSLGDTLQAVRDHQPVDPLETPGTADLTAHVDFEALTRAAAPCAPSRLTPQGVFLERLGITARAQQLAKSLTGDALESHIAAHRRLTHPEEMGNLFKVIGFVPDGRPFPPGLEA